MSGRAPRSHRRRRRIRFPAIVWPLPYGWVWKAIWTAMWMTAAVVAVVWLVTDHHRPVRRERNINVRDIHWAR